MAFILVDLKSISSGRLHWYFCESGGLGEVRESQKRAKLRGVRPLFEDCKYVIIVVRKGCTLIAELKLRIFDRESIFIWYVVESLILRVFES